MQRVGAERRPMAGALDHGVADEALTVALAALPDDERAVLVLRYYVDLSVADAADALGVAQGTVKTRTRRALPGCGPTACSALATSTTGRTQATKPR